MPYPPNTVLKRVKPLPIPEGDVDHPLNRVSIIGPSPIRSTGAGEWAGIPGDHILVTPVGTFGANVAIPDQILQRDYEVVSYGETPGLKEISLVERQRTMHEAGVSPEMQFAADARAAAKGEVPAASKVLRQKTTHA